jgi:hypothetical protein
MTSMDALTASLLLSLPTDIIGKILYHCKLDTNAIKRCQRRQKDAIARKKFPKGHRPWQFHESKSIRAFACTCKFAYKCALKYRTRFYSSNYMRFEKEALRQYHIRRIDWATFAIALIELFQTGVQRHSINWRPDGFEHSFRDLLNIHYSNPKLSATIWGQINFIMGRSVTGCRWYYRQYSDIIVWLKNEKRGRK